MQAPMMAMAMPKRVDAAPWLIVNAGTNNTSSVTAAPITPVMMRVFNGCHSLDILSSF
jgi:hypothetical protein